MFLARSGLLTRNGMLHAVQTNIMRQVFCSDHHLHLLFAARKIITRGICDCLGHQNPTPVKAVDITKSCLLNSWILNFKTLPWVVSIKGMVLDTNNRKVEQTEQEDERLKPEERCSSSKMKPPDHVFSSDRQVCQSRVFLPTIEMAYVPWRSKLSKLFSQVKFALTSPQGGEMFECKSRAELRMMAIPMFDQTELLPNGNSYWLKC